MTMCQDLNKKRVVEAAIIKNEEIAKGIYRMELKQPEIAEKTNPGQFINLYCKSEALLLPRPISISEVCCVEGTVKVVYAVVGKGTAELASFKAGESVKILGPLGNGFDVQADAEESVIVSGGVGLPPMIELAKQLSGKITAFVGFRSEPYLIEELGKYATVHIATDDGSVGHKGNVIELMDMKNASGQMIYACGPKPMLRALSAWANEKNLPAQISLEERMGCGVGSCVGCVVKIKDDSQQGWTYKKVCKDGPVFMSEEVMFDEIFKIKG